MMSRELPAMDDAVWTFCYLALVVLCGYYAEEIGQRLWKPKVRTPSREWRALVEPVVSKCRLAEVLEMNTTFNTDGSKALAVLLERLADELDRRS
jgi:hypothetical protein